LARTIANQVSIAVQNALLYSETRRLSHDLEQRVIERTAQLEKAHKRTETLLRIITELTASLDLEQVLNRTLYLINQIVDAGQITVLVVRPGEKKLYRLASLGYAGQAGVGGKTTPFNADQGLAGWVISTRQSALIDDVLQDARWILLSETPEPLHRSAMAVPLMVGAEVLGVLLLYHSEVGHFSPDQLDLVQAAANQVAVAINNAELYRLIRDQAEDLGNLFRRQQEEASRSRAILEAVADGVLVTDANMHITLFNASAETMLGLQRQQVIGKSLEHFIGLFGSAAGAWLETIRTWSEDPTTCQVGDIYSEQITLEDGRVISVHLSPVSLRDTFLGTVSTFRDITHQVELDRLKSEFVATVSHELRTPMTSIKGYVELLLMGVAGAMSPQQEQFLQIVKNNTERLAALVNDLLDVSRIEAGRVSLDLQPLDLEEVVSQALAELRRRAESENKPMSFELDCPSSLPPVLGDWERVRQILDNLLENAYAYTAANGHVVVRLRRVDSEIQVDVQDDGIGIPLELQERIFERFYRGEHPFVLATSGTGLGLSIVQHLVGMQGGRIWVKSSGIPGEGSVFSFTLPLYNARERQTDD
jgi:PAS domain S-box-containing protein